MKALCTGSFDPITVGHYDFISRAAKLFESVVVAVSTNTEKKYMFTDKERLGFARAAFKDLPNVTVVCFDGWAADLAAEHGADLIIKGVRNGEDLDYEDLIATVNREVSGVETLFIPCDPKYSRVCSLAVREMIKHGKDYRPFLPKGVEIGKGE